MRELSEPRDVKVFCFFFVLFLIVFFLLFDTSTALLRVGVMRISSMKKGIYLP